MQVREAGLPTRAPGKREEPVATGFSRHPSAALFAANRALHHGMELRGLRRSRMPSVTVQEGECAFPMPRKGGMACTSRGREANR
jgi:hypothetical protein